MTDPLAWWNSLGRPLACLPRWAALAVLAVLAAAMAWSVVTVAPVDREETAHQEARPESAEGDLALYRHISERVIAGEGYYPAAMDEQRARNYPTRPFFTVRLPALAQLHVLIGADGVRRLNMVLLLGCLLGLFLRLGSGMAAAERMGALFMLALGGSAVAAPQSGYVHEILAGMLLTLAFVFYSPQRWWPSLVAAGLALSVRELAAPFVLLWLAFAVTGKRWREVAGIAVLLLLFVVGMYLHYLGVEGQRLAGDRASQGWDAMIGLALPLMAISRLTAFLFLPISLAAPLALLPLVGWLGLGGRFGLFATLWFAGMFAGLALFARPENFYWAQLVLPAYMAGLAFAPRAIFELAHGVIRARERQS